MSRFLNECLWAPGDSNGVVAEINDLVAVWAVDTNNNQDTSGITGR
jgi:hypothetical protein